MPCYQSTNLPPGVTTTGRTGYATEAECLAACKEGACCEGTTCSVKPQCQCQGTGKVFKGVGTVCTPNPCTLLCSPTCSAPEAVRLQVTVGAALNTGSDSNPFDPALPDWAKSCISSTPQILSGEYILRFSGLGSLTTPQYDVTTPVYTYETTSDKLSFYYTCFSTPFPPRYPVNNPFFTAAVPATNGVVALFRMNRDCGATANLVTQLLGMDGPSIGETCQGQSLGLDNWDGGTMGQSPARVNKTIRVLFSKFYPSSTPGGAFTEFVGGLGGIAFECDVQISEA